MNSSPRKMGLKPQGVTLIELMIVVALIGVMATFAGPSVYRAVQRANSRATAREVVNSMRFARAQAMSRGEPLWMQVTTGTGVGQRGRIRVARQFNVASPQPPPRSCRQFNGGADVNFGAAQCGPGLNQSCVFEVSLNNKAGVQMIKGQDPAGIICFSPDGRVLRADGRPLTPGPSACSGEDYVVWTGDIDAAIGPGVTNCVSSGSEAARIAQRVDRQMVHSNKIAIPYNGAVKMEQ